MAQAGLFDEPIKIYEVVQASNEYGEQIDTYELKYETRARIQNTSGSRINDSNEIFYSYNKIFIVRYYVPVEDFYRIYWDGHYYRINNIDKNKKLQQISIDCELVKE